MPAIYNALDLVVKGKKVQNNKFGTLIQPLQFLPQDEKDDQWAAMNMDYYEWQGLQQIRRNAGKLIKWYKLAEGEIDRSDYFVEEGEQNEMKDIVDYLRKEDQSTIRWARPFMTWAMC
jgi:hypothetical protein